MANHSIGTISHGTLRTPDLIGAFAFELGNIKDWRGKDYGPLLSDCQESLRNYGTDWENQEVDDALVTELFDALNDCADDGFRFGAHDGDGADFGFWAINEEEQS